jgi:CheY-like chemotaxis protein
MRILVVEDLGADALLFREALRDAGLAQSLTFARDGIEALEKLRSEPAPDLLLLDLDLPRVSGREVLDELRSDPRLRLLPVVVITTSPSPDDIAFAYEHHANAYVRKPNGFMALSAVAEAIRDFWIRTTTLPWGASPPRGFAPPPTPG